MVRVYLDNKEAVLPDDFEITLNLQNDFLNDRSEDATFPFSLSVSANRHIFGFPERPADGAGKSSFSGRIMAGPFCLILGGAYIDNVEGDSIELYITSETKSFWKQAKKLHFKYDGYQRLNDWTEEEARATLEKNFDGVFAPLLDTANNKLINSYHAIGSLLTFDSRPFPKIRHLLYYYIQEKMEYTIQYSALDSIEWFKNLLLIYIGKYTFTKAYPLPDITFYDLLEELEKRFAVRFLANDTNKTVTITLFNDLIQNRGLSFLAYDDPAKTYHSEEDYNKTYIFQDKKTDDGTIDFVASKYQNGYDTENTETIECKSTQVGKSYINYAGINHPCAAVGEAITNEGELSSDYRLGIYKGYINSYPTMNADELAWNSLYLNYHKERVGILRRKKSITFQLNIGNISVLKNIGELFRKKVLINHVTYIAINAEIVLNSGGVSEFTLECTQV